MCFSWFKKNEIEKPIEEVSDVIVEEVKVVTPKPEYYCYSQKDPRWGNLKIGKTNLTMAKYGCLITSISMILKRPPYEVLQILNEKGAFNSSGMLLWDIAGKALGFSYKWLSAKDIQKTLCVAETNSYAPTYPQHFVLWIGDGRIVDPLELPCKEKKNGYNITSFRRIA